jgi:DNA topoisomerase-1
MTKKLVIVESPAKARTVGKILGAKYNVKASLGHVRDLPERKLGVDVNNSFSPEYVIPRQKKQVIKELKEAAEKAGTIYLATDPDREGEAISWHIIEATGLKKLAIRRVVFHEITKATIEDAFQHPRQIDMSLVNSQQARRILDRLVGYKISPLLWRKVRGRLSAGRVQSVALRMIAEREREIQKFVSEEYWTIEAELAKMAEVKKKAYVFRAKLVGLADEKAKFEIKNEQECQVLVDKLKPAVFRISKVGKKRTSRQPAPPFITSTLQQEAWRKLHFTAQRTMVVAQQLYEGLPIGEEETVGLITYMRTDSTRVADVAIQETRTYIESKFGADFLPARPRTFTRKVKGAQEAHEAIRPTKVEREPELIKSYLTSEQAKLYELIWKRMVASQMAAASFDNTTIDIEAEEPQEKTVYLLRTSASIPHFLGFRVLYTEGKDEADDEEEGLSRLPQLAKDESLKLRELYSLQHFTQPLPRYNEATLVKALEEKGIGRPSTYAPIISLIQKRGYVQRKEGKFFPMELGFTVNDLLVEHFSNIVDIEFTAQMEERLDEVARGKQGWIELVQDFYAPLEEKLQKANTQITRVKVPDQPTEEVCPQCNKPLVIRMGRYGSFLACSGYPECKFTKPLMVRRRRKYESSRNPRTES